MMSTGMGIKKPHFVSEARNFRHCDRVNNVTCQVLYPLGNDTTNERINIGFSKSNNDIVRIYNSKTDPKVQKSWQYHRSKKTIYHSFPH